jgi:endonuclease/exonuclease/phosphatase (EEP) superfamily protein YafD
VPKSGWSRYWWIWAGVIPVAAWAVVRAFGLEAGFPIVPLMAFTPYVAAFAAIIAGVAVALRNWAAAIVGGVAALVLLAAILPRVIGDEEPIPSGGEELRVLAANIHHGTADAPDLVARVRELDVDVLSVEELTPSFDRKLRAAGLQRLLPNSLVNLHRGASGGGLYSRLPLRAIPAPPHRRFRMPRGMLRMPDGDAVRVVSVHPYPPTSRNVDLWQGELGELPAAGSGPPWVLAGDFNGTLDFDAMRRLLGTGYRDAAEVTGKGLDPTWPQDRLIPFPIAIDHVFAAEGLSVAGYEVEGLPGSDHRAVFARLGIP